MLCIDSFLKQAGAASYGKTKRETNSSGFPKGSLFEQQSGEQQ
jgi:hypothetical protein